MKRFVSSLGFLASLVSSLSYAQSAPRTLDERKVIRYEEIERGFFFEGRGGFWGVINPPALAGTPRYFAPGQAIGVDMGFDIGERISAGVFFLASASRMLSDYTGLSTSRAASGDFSAIIPGASVKVRLVGFDDLQSVKRTWIYVRVAGGPAFYSPKELLPQLDVLISAGGGFEYFTRLRHVVIGVEANVNMMALTQAFGFSILPTVKYAF